MLFENTAQVLVRHIEFFHQKIRIPDHGIVGGMMHKLDDGRFDLFNNSAFPVLQWLKTEFIQFFNHRFHVDHSGLKFKPELPEFFAAGFHS